VRRVVANNARSSWRRRRAENKAVARLESDVRVGNDLPDDTEDFWAAVRSLPTRQSQAIALFYLEDLPVSEIAGVIGCAESTARVHLTRGRRNLAKMMDGMA
jgi:RNA polymerase sigma-70 factor (ECF subfamily)